MDKRHVTKLAGDRAADAFVMEMAKHREFLADQPLSAVYAEYNRLIAIEQRVVAKCGSAASHSRRRSCLAKLQRDADEIQFRFDNLEVRLESAPIGGVLEAFMLLDVAVAIAVRADAASEDPTWALVERVRNYFLGASESESMPETPRAPPESDGSLG